MFMLIELSSHVLFFVSCTIKTTRHPSSLSASLHNTHSLNGGKLSILVSSFLLPTYPVSPDTNTIPLPQQSSNRETRTESPAAVNMATEVAATSTASEGPMAGETVPEKPVILIGIDDSEESYYALEWILDHFFAPHTPNFSFELVVVHAKLYPVTPIELVGPGAGTVVAQVDTALIIAANRVQKKAKEMCISKSVHHAKMVIWEGDARNVLFEAADKFHASMLVIGSHGYGVIERALLGSVSDYCAHHAHCSVMIVKKPKR